MTQQLGEFEVGARVSPVFGDGVFKVESKTEADVVLRDVMTRDQVTASAASVEWVSWEEPPAHETGGAARDVIPLRAGIPETGSVKPVPSPIPRRAAKSEAPADPRPSVDMVAKVLDEWRAADAGSEAATEVAAAVAAVGESNHVAGAGDAAPEFDQEVAEVAGEGAAHGEEDSTAGWDEAQRLAEMGATVSVNGGKPASTAAGIHEEISKLARTALAEDADPESGEIRTPRGRAKPEQASLSGMPPRKPGIWPDVVVLGRAERVYSVVMSFGGSLDLKSSNPEDVWLAEQLLLGNPVTLEVAVVTDRTAHQLVKGQVVGAARVGVFDAAQAGETGYLRLQGENRRLRGAFEALQNAADVFSAALGDDIRRRGGAIPRDLEEAHWGLREAIAGARP